MNRCGYKIPWINAFCVRPKGHIGCHVDGEHRLMELCASPHPTRNLTCRLMARHSGPHESDAFAWSNL